MVAGRFSRFTVATFDSSARKKWSSSWHSRARLRRMQFIGLVFISTPGVTRRSAAKIISLLCGDLLLRRFISLQKFISLAAGGSWKVQGSRGIFERRVPWTKHLELSFGVLLERTCKFLKFDFFRNCLSLKYFRKFCS